MNWKDCFALFALVLILTLQTPSLDAQMILPAELTLEQARELLLRHNPLLQVEKLNSQIHRGVLVEATRRPNPELVVDSAGLGSRPNAGPFLDNQEFSTRLSYEFETAGKREKRTVFARYGVELARLKLEDRIRLLSFELKQRYYRVVLAQHDLELAREVLRGFRELVALNRTRYQNGDISGRELRRIEAELYRFQEEVIAAEVGLENAQDRLLALLGSGDFTLNFRAVDPFDPSFQPPPMSQLKELSLRFRSDLRAQHERIDQAESGIALEKARRIPNFQLFAGYRRDFGHDGAIVGMSMPLFVFNRNEGQLFRAKAQHEQEQWRLQLVEIQIYEEIQLAFNDLDANRRRLKTLTSDYLEKTRQTRDISETAYRLGSISLIELLDAQRAYSEAARLYNRALYDFQISRGRLEFAVGKDLQ